MELLAKNGNPNSISNFSVFKLVEKDFTMENLIDSINNKILSRKRHAEYAE